MVNWKRIGLIFLGGAVVALVMIGIQESGLFSGLAPVVTRAEYDAVQPGMTYYEVAAVVGEEGQEQARTSFPSPAPGAMAITSATYLWQNPIDRSNMLVTFSNERVVSKAQAGLQ